MDIDQMTIKEIKMQIEFLNKFIRTIILSFSTLSLLLIISELYNMTEIIKIAIPSTHTFIFCYLLILKKKMINKYRELYNI